MSESVNSQLLKYPINGLDERETARRLFIPEAKENRYWANFAKVVELGFHRFIDKVNLSYAGIEQLGEQYIKPSIDQITDLLRQAIYNFLSPDSTHVRDTTLAIKNVLEKPGIATAIASDPHYLLLLDSAFKEVHLVTKPGLKEENTPEKIKEAYMDLRGILELLLEHHDSLITGFNACPQAFPNLLARTIDVAEYFEKAEKPGNDLYKPSAVQVAALEIRFPVGEAPARG